jgi:multicomponent Na+:H+ antiporter subunit F
MNEWEIACVALLVGVLPCGAVCLRASLAEGIAALQLVGMIAALALLVLAEGSGRQPFATLAVVLVVLSFAGTMVFLRFLERSGDERR